MTKIKICHGVAKATPLHNHLHALQATSECVVAALTARIRCDTMALAYAECRCIRRRADRCAALFPAKPLVVVDGKVLGFPGGVVAHRGHSSADHAVAEDAA